MTRTEAMKLAKAMKLSKAMTRVMTRVATFSEQRASLAAFLRQATRRLDDPDTASRAARANWQLMRGDLEMALHLVHDVLESDDLTRRPKAGAWIAGNPTHGDEKTRKAKKKR